MPGKRSRQAYAQGARFVPVRHFLFHVAEQGNDVQGVAVEGLAAFCGHDAAARALEQAHAVVLLKLADGQAHGRLGHVQHERGPRDAARLKDRDENVQMSERHGIYKQQVMDSIE